MQDFSTRMPAVYISKYNRFVDNIIARINKILGKSYDPVRVRLQSTTKKTTTKRRNNSTKKKTSTKTPGMYLMYYKNKNVISRNVVGLKARIIHVCTYMC